MLLWILLVSFVLTNSQQITKINQDGFNMTLSTVVGTNAMTYTFWANDAPNVVYALKLVSIFEATNINGVFTPNGFTSNLGQYTVANNTTPSLMSINNTFTYTPINPAAVNITSLTFAHTYWLKSSKHNVCPDFNIGRFCMKMVQTFTYNRVQKLPNTNLVFQWQLSENNVLANVMNTTIQRAAQVEANLGFVSVENMAIVTETAFPSQGTPLAVTTMLHQSLINPQLNGIWVIYNLGTTQKPNVVHDPVMGINLNTGAALTIQIVTAALALGVVLAFLVILGCSIYIYRGNSKAYYIKLRQTQELEE